jgi:hypothetical protein
VSLAGVGSTLAFQNEEIVQGTSHSYNHLVERALQGMLDRMTRAEQSLR